MSAIAPLEHTQVRNYPPFNMKKNTLINVFFNNTMLINVTCNVLDEILIILSFFSVFFFFS